MVQKLMAVEADYQFILTIRTAINSKRRRSFPRRLSTRPRSQKRRAVRWGGPELRMEGKLSRPSGPRLLFSFLSCFLLFVSTEGGAQERERLRVSTLFLGSSLLPLWVAQDQGIFTRAGLDVQLVWMQSGLSTSALLAGEVDAIFGTPQITLTALMGKNPPPLVAIAAWGSASEHWLVVDSSVRSVKELENKTLATSRPKSADHGYIIAILERFGVDPRRVIFLSAGGQGGRLAAVQSGRVTGSVFNRYYPKNLS